MSSSLKKEIEAKLEEYQGYLHELEQVECTNFQPENALEIKRRVSNKPKAPRYSTGIEVLDCHLRGGFSVGTMINLAGENFAGKTTLVLKILHNITQGHKVVFFNFEMYEDLLVQKMKTWKDEQLRNLLVVQVQNSLHEIEDTIRTQAKQGVQFFAIDSRMKITVSIKMEDYQRNSLISQKLSKLCQELGVIILLINQISETDLRSGRLALKGSGDQNYDSDVTLYIKVSLNNDTGKVQKRQLICSKDRVNGERWIDTLPVFEA